MCFSWRIFLGLALCQSDKATACYVSIPKAVPDKAPTCTLLSHSRERNLRYHVISFPIWISGHASDHCILHQTWDANNGRGLGNVAFNLSKLKLLESYAEKEMDYAKQIKSEYLWGLTIKIHLRRPSMVLIHVPWNGENARSCLSVFVRAMVSTVTEGST